MLKDENNKPLPEFPIEIKKTAKKLIFYAGLNKFELPINKNQEIDLIALDVWISDVLYHVSKGADDKPKSKILLT